MQICDRCGNLASDLIRANVEHLMPAMLGWSTQRVCVRNGRTTIPVFLCLRCFEPFPSENIAYRFPTLISGQIDVIPSKRTMTR